MAVAAEEREIAYFENAIGDGTCFSLAYRA